MAKLRAAAPTNADLVALARAGDRDAFAVLAEQHRPVALRVVGRVIRDEALAGDFVQEATLTAYLALAQLRDPERFGAWLCGIALNLCRGHLRRSRADEPLDEAQSAAAGGDPAEIVEEIELRRRVMAAVAELPAGMRAATLLFYYRELSVAEIAESLGISEGAVKVRLNRARTRLREQFAASRRIGMAVRSRSMQKVSVVDVVPHETGADEPGRSSYVVMLANQSGTRALPIWVSRDVVGAIAMGARGARSPRPMTIAFAASLLEAAGAEVDRVEIDRLEGDTFFATVRLSGPNGEREVDARPSDAIGLALRTGSPIFASDDVLAKAGADVPAGKAAAPGRGLDALVSEMEELFQRPHSDPSKTEEEKQEAYRRIAETVFGGGG